MNDNDKRNKAFQQFMKRQHDYNMQKKDGDTNALEVKNFKEFKELYDRGEIKIFVRKNYATEVAGSEIMDKNNARAIKFWGYISFAFIFILPIPIWIIGKSILYAIGSVIFGFMIAKANDSSATQFISEELVNSEKFFNDILSKTTGIISVETKDGKLKELKLKK